MNLPSPLPPASNDADSHVAAIFSEAWVSGSITKHDRRGLSCALQRGGLSIEGHRAIDRIVHAVRRGWLRLA